MRKYRLLIVDDDEVDRRMYCKLLRQHGSDTCDIQQAVNGAAGLAALRTSQFDCVLLDFGLSDMTGRDFLIAAAVDGELPCAVVLITGQGSEAIAVDAMKRGAQDYLMKDKVNSSSLWRAIAQAVIQVELQQRLSGSLRELTAANRALEQEVATRKATEIELRAAKEAAEQANQAKTRFVAMVTHELRTPLNGILGYAQLLRIEAGLSTLQDAHVGAMMQAGRHLLEMIEGVLDFASIENGRMELRPEDVSVRDLTEGCIAFISPLATERGLSLRVVNSHDAPRHFIADPARLRQVLLNLLGNAVKYTDAGGVELRLLAGASAGALRVEIADTGRGIKPAHRDLLFQDFERLEAVTSVEGTGLGLAIAARIVRLMGGTINYEPNPNGGSIFWFELPAIGNAVPQPAEPVKKLPAAVTSGKRILLVDDIKINRDIIGAFLESAGHAVTMTDNGKDGIRLAGEQHFDLILMDVRMPGIDGLEAARRVRALPGSHAQAPILALTAYSFPDQLAQCRDAGMDGHVPKPVDYETLINAISVAINRRARDPEEVRLPRRPGETGDEAPPRAATTEPDRTTASLPPNDAAFVLQPLPASVPPGVALPDPAQGATMPDLAQREGPPSEPMPLRAASGFNYDLLSPAANRFRPTSAQDAQDADDPALQLRLEARAALAALDAMLNENRAEPR